MSDMLTEWGSNADRDFKGVSLTPKSIATRARIIAVAERLFARKGIEGVSLSEINKVARQRHSNACHYHFGGKDGLIQAILDKHIPGIVARRNVMFDEIEAAGTLDIRKIVHAFVEPAVAKLHDPDGGKEFIRISAQLMPQHTLASQQLGSSPFSLPADIDRLRRTLAAAIATRNPPDIIVRQRLFMAGVMLFHGLAEYSRLMDAVPELRSKASTALFVRDLETMILAAMIVAPEPEASD